MKKLLQYTLLTIMALAFSACSSVNHNLILGFDTNPQGAEIICDGKSVGFSPLNYNQATNQHIVLDDGKYSQMKKEGEVGLPKCKAKWTSGYEDYYYASAKVEDFALVKKENKLNTYLFAQTLNRPNQKGYMVDSLAEKRFTKIYNAPKYNFKVNPKGGQIVCDDEINMIDSIKNALQSGIFRITKCKAVFISGYEQYFKDSINLDKQDISMLFVQTINRPNTAGYAQDMQYALEIEKKEIMEANERARTQAAQMEALSALQRAQAAQDQARAAQQQANAARDQANAVRDQTNAVKQWINKPTMCNTFGSITTCY